MLIARHVLRLVVRDIPRTLATGISMAIAAALTASVLLFGSASGATVTSRALADLPVDAQVLLAPGTEASAAARTLQADQAVESVLPFGLVHFDSARLDRSGTATQTGVGVIIGIDAGYPQATGLFSVSQGKRRPGEITVSRDLATNLGAVPGDPIILTLPGGGTVQVTVSGIVDTTGGDLILGPVDAAHRAVGTDPPPNVAVTDLVSIRSIAARIPVDAVAAEPTTGVPGSPTPVSTAVPAVRRDLHLRYDHSALPGDPVAATRWLDDIRRRLEIAAGGSYTVVDDAAASLEPVITELAWGKILFVFLALPGIVLALAMSRLAADATAESTRRHVALLRARGATNRQLQLVLSGAMAITALLASLLGSVAGVAVGWLRFGVELSTADPTTATLFAVTASVAIVTVLASVAAALPLRDQLRSEVALGRQELQRAQPPLWKRLYLDVLAIALAIAVFVFLGGAGVHPVFDSEGDPTVTLAVTSFIAPLLLWTGLTFLLLRVALRFLHRRDPAVRWLRSILGPGGELAARSLQARAAGASRTAVLIALTVSFATSLLVFDATYRQQQLVDAELTLGADLRAVPATASDETAAAAAAGPDVESVTPFADRIVYVGSEAQDLLAIDPATMRITSPLSDTFFKDTTASAAMDALAATPDGILVSGETVTDYSLVIGDRLRISVPDATGSLRPIDFRMVGVALEFPTAPSDAFLVANLSYVTTQSGDPQISFLLARSSSDPTSAAQALRSRLGDSWTVTDISSTTARLANGITSVDLGDLVAIEMLFAVFIAALGTGLFLVAELTIRRRELATLEAIGATPAQLRASVMGEIIVLGAAGILCGLLVGGLVAGAHLQVLAGLFDPPASRPAVPGIALLLLILAVAAGLAAAVAVADRMLARLPILGVLRER